MRMSQLDNCTVTQRCFWGMIWTAFPQFLPPASHAVDHSRCADAVVSTRPHLLVDDIVIRFDIQLDSFRVSTSSAIAIRKLPVFRFSYSTSTLAHHWLQNCGSSVRHIHHCLLLHHTVSGFNRPIIDSFRIFHTCSRPTIDLLPDSHDRPIVDSLPGSFVWRITLSLDT